ncbi:MAG: hypothetical protein JW881_00175 [Spirochaetales bacterium]|nr:hypothetical protein [Spirochaetales bacterium]
MYCKSGINCGFYFVVVFVMCVSGCESPVTDSGGLLNDISPVTKAPDVSRCSVRGDITTDTPLFTWVSVPRASSYTLYVIKREDEAIVLRDMHIGEAGAPYTPVRPLPEKVPLRWTVRGENEKGAGPPSPWVDFKITPPDGVFRVTGNPPLFEWPEVAGAQYWLLVGDDGDLGSSTWLVDRRDLGTNGYQSPSAFPAGRTYYWKVKYKAGPVEAWYWSEIMPFEIPGTPTVPTYRQLAEYYAPVIFQDVDTEGNCSHADGGRADYITNVNFDGDWYARNNWENEPCYLLKAYVYYAVVESSSRYYITYAIFHPRDYTNETLILEHLDEHENDMEGLWMSVYKNGSFYGHLEAMVTAAHYDFYQYSNYGVGERENIDGGIILTGGKPTVFIECRGHGIKGYAEWYGRDFPGNDGVVYRYSGNAQHPLGVTAHRTYANACTYDLVHIDELWERRPGGVLYDPGKLYYSTDTFLGDNVASCGCKLTPNSPHPPWGWDDWNDGGGLQGGEQFTDPAYYFDYTLSLENIPGHSCPCNDSYIFHPYTRP